MNVVLDKGLEFLISVVAAVDCANGEGLESSVLAVIDMQVHLHGVGCDKTEEGDENRDKLHAEVRFMNEVGISVCQFAAELGMSRPGIVRVGGSARVFILVIALAPNGRLTVK